MEQRLNILLVDDDEVDAITVKRAFGASPVPCQVTVARDGLEALAVLRAGKLPRERLLVLLDINMPKMGGIEFLGEVRADPALQNLVVIVMTTSSEDNVRVDAYQLRVAGYVLKPVTFQALEKIVATLGSYWTLMQLP